MTYVWCTWVCLRTVAQLLSSLVLLMKVRRGGEDRSARRALARRRWRKVVLEPFEHRLLEQMPHSCSQLRDHEGSAVVWWTSE